MQRPCVTRKLVKTARLGATASRLVGMASAVRLNRMPSRRSMRGLKKPTTRLAVAMPKVLAFTPKPIAAGVTP
jgi:hypothetical protein